MGEYADADEEIERMQYRWETQMDSRLRHKAAPHAPGCCCPGCVQLRTESALLTNAKRRTATLSIERAFKETDPYDVPTHIICKRCQTTGLHWGLKDGKPELREEGGWLHKCKKIEGVTLNLPNILDPQ